MPLDTDLVAWLESVDRVQYRAAPFPVATDGGFVDLLDRIRSSSSHEVEAVRDALRQVGASAYAWAEYARRAEALAILERSADRLRSGLIALALLMTDEEDPRDVMVALATPHYTGHLVGADVPRLFDEASAFATTAVARLMREFGRRVDINPQSFKFELVETPRGNEFRTLL